MPLAFPIAENAGLTLRPMSDGDLPFVAALYASTRADEIAAFGWPDETKQAFLRQQHEAQHAHYRRQYGDADWLIVERDGDALGRLYLLAGENEVLLIDISLLPEARGQGLGGALLGDVIAAANAAGRPVLLHVEKHNRARRLYERLGFAVTRSEGVYDEMVRPADPPGV